MELRVFAEQWKMNFVVLFIRHFSSYIFDLLIILKSFLQDSELCFLKIN
jgi:hypothetical protein